MRNHLADPNVQLNTSEKLKNCMKELVEKFVPLMRYAAVATKCR